MSVNWSELKVAVIEDSDVAMEQICDQLKQLGVTQISKYADGKTGFEAIKTNAFSLILADWNMPGMTGFELLQAVRKEAQWKSLPFIMITADSDLERIVQAISTGVSSYIVKPVTADVLRSKVEGLFKAKK